MNNRATLHLLAFPVGLMGAVQIVFALLSVLVFHDHEEAEFFTPAVGMLLLAAVLAIAARRIDVARISFRDSLFFATVTWIATGALGAVPIVLITGVSVADGVFESISALTTTGATVLSGGWNISPCWRCFCPLSGTSEAPV